MNEKGSFAFVIGFLFHLVPSIKRTFRNSCAFRNSSAPLMKEATAHIQQSYPLVAEHSHTYNHKLNLSEIILATSIALKLVLFIFM